jgi:hypothetical protein
MNDRNFQGGLWPKLRRWDNAVNGQPLPLQLEPVRPRHEASGRQGVRSFAVGFLAELLGVGARYSAVSVREELRPSRLYRPAPV